MNRQNLHMRWSLQHICRFYNIQKSNFALYVSGFWQKTCQNTSRDTTFWIVTFFLIIPVRILFQSQFFIMTAVCSCRYFRVWRLHNTYALWYWNIPDCSLWMFYVTAAFPFSLWSIVFSVYILAQNALVFQHKSDLLSYENKYNNQEI